MTKSPKRIKAVKTEELPNFNELWMGLWDFANANGSITLTAQQAREHFDYISRDVHIGEMRLAAKIIEQVNKKVLHCNCKYCIRAMAKLRKDFLTPLNPKRKR